MFFIYRPKFQISTSLVYKYTVIFEIPMAKGEIAPGQTHENSALPVPAVIASATAE
jgi:hypothetical protein